MAPTVYVQWAPLNGIKDQSDNWITFSQSNQSENWLGHWKKEFGWWRHLRHLASFGVICVICVICLLRSEVFWPQSDPIKRRFCIFEMFFFRMIKCMDTGCWSIKAMQPTTEVLPMIWSMEMEPSLTSLAVIVIDMKKAKKMTSKMAVEGFIIRMGIITLETS